MHKDWGKLFFENYVGNVTDPPYFDNNKFFACIIGVSERISNAIILSEIIVVNTLTLEFVATRCFVIS